MSRSGSSPSSTSTSGARSPRSSWVAAPSVTTSAITRLPVTTYATSAVSAPSASCRSPRATGSSTSPDPRWCHARSRTRRRSSASRSGSVRRSPSSTCAISRSSARSAAIDSSWGARTGWTRLAIIRARSDHSNRTSGLRESAASCSARTPSRRPWPTTLVCRSRLPNELCHACRSERPARTCRKRFRASPSSRCQVGPHVAVQEAHPQRRPSVDPDPGQVGIGRVELTSAQPNPRRLQPNHGGRPVEALVIKLVRQPLPFAEQARCLRPISTSAASATASARVPMAAASRRGNDAMPAGPRSERGPGRRRAGSGQASARLRLARRSFREP